jgi:hypothetical protein
MTRRLPVLAFFTAVLLPVLLLGHDGPWLGAGDLSIRERAPFPGRLTPGSFRDFDEWFADRLGLRYPLIYAGAELHIALLRRPLDRHIFFGRDDWMFWTDDEERTPANMADSRGKLRFSASETARIDAQVRSIKTRFAACGVPAVISVVPNKQSIYGEFLFGEQTKAPPTRLDALMDTLSEPAREMFVDVRSALMAGKQAQAPTLLYPKTESHWNELGAFYGYLAIIEALARQMPIPHRELADLGRYQITSAPYPGGDMAARVLFSPWRFPDELVQVRPKPPLPDIQPVEIDHEHAIYRNPQGKGLGRIVLFGDSFAYGLMPLLAQHFEEAHRITSNVFRGDVIAALHADAVVLEMVERYTPRLLEPQVELARACER